jgi:hypothetical protein
MPDPLPSSGTHALCWTCMDWFAPYIAYTPLGRELVTTVCIKCAQKQEGEVT